MPAPGSRRGRRARCPPRPGRRRLGGRFPALAAPGVVAERSIGGMLERELCTRARSRSARPPASRSSSWIRTRCSAPAGARAGVVAARAGGWLVTRRDLALTAMRDSESFTVDDPRFSTGRVVGPSMLTLDGAEHGRHRDPFARPFRLDAVRERFTAVVEAATERLLDRLEPHGRAELRRELAGPLATVVVARALGLRDADTDAVLGWYDAIVDSVTGVAAGRPVTPAGTTAFSALRSSIEPVLDSRPRVVARRGRCEPGRRPQPRGGGLERGRADVRRHRDDRGHDRQRGAAPARSPRSAGAPRARPEPDRRRRSRSRSGWSRLRR